MPKPVNWQDFESLCKKIWEGQWNCLSIKKNGRTGQPQHGVDIYGIPDGKENYYGIQCKGKDDYTNSQLTVEEIDIEIEKAKTFNPKLEHFIFTTTANKDYKIEEYIRKINISSKRAGLFSIDIFSWEDIVDIIEEDKAVYDWYLKGKLHKDNYDLNILFNEQTDDIVLEPQFVQINLTVIKKKPVLSSNADKTVAGAYAKPINNAKEYYLNSVPLEIKFINTGDVALEYYKISFHFDSDNIKLENKNYRSLGINHDVDFYFHNRNFFIDDNTLYYDSNSNYPILVPGDGKSLSIFVKCPAEIFDFLIKCEFISKEYRFEKEIICHIKPIIEMRNITREADEGEKESYSERIMVKTKLVESG